MAWLCLAQQEAQRAQFYVEKAKQDQRQKIIQAEGEAEAARMVTSMSHTCGPGVVISAPVRPGLTWHFNTVFSRPSF